MKNISVRTSREASVKPEVMRLAVGTPLDAACSSRNEPHESEASTHVQTQLKFVQIGLWEVRRRWLAGQFEDFETILAHLDEDVELLRQVMEGTDPDRRRPRRRKTVPLR